MNQGEFLFPQQLELPNSTLFLFLIFFTAMFMPSGGLRFSFAANFPQVKRTCWHCVHWQWNEAKWFYLPQFSGDLSYLCRKIHFRKVLLLLWSHNVPLLHHSYYVGNHFIQFITRVASVVFFVICGHKWRYKQDHVIAIRSLGYLLSKYGMSILVFNKTVPKWLFKIHVLVFGQKETDSTEKPG